MKKLKRYTALLLALVLTAGLLAGCGREKDVSFRVAMSRVPATLDPALAATDEEKIVVSHLFENLMKLQSDGSGGCTAVNGMARSYQCDTTVEGQETYTFRLRTGGHLVRRHPGHGRGLCLRLEAAGGPRHRLEKRCPAGHGGRLQRRPLRQSGCPAGLRSE